MTIDRATPSLGPIAPAAGGPSDASRSLAALPGRQALLERLRELGRAPAGEGPAILLAIVSADELARISDSLGPGPADAILAEMAQRLLRLAGPDPLLARIDREEFALVGPALADESALRDWSTELTAWLRQPYRAGGMEIAAPASVGVAQGPACDGGGFALLRSAEMAQFAARSSGGDRVSYFRPQLRNQLVQRVRDCRNAGNFTLHYQPILTLASPRRLVGAESLLRWRHPVRGLLFPGDFRPIFEDERTAQLIGELVIEEAAIQARRWLDQGVEVGRLAINASAAWLRAPGSVEALIGALGRRRVPPGRIALEVPEDVYCAPDRAELSGLLAALRGRGIEVHVDGWALGMACPAELSALPIDGLKLDRTMLAEATDEALAALVAEARERALVVTAEGVELEEQAARLEVLGCERAQGWLFARPMAGAKMAAFRDKLAGRGPAARAA
jgi:predicted signal transduction protein with EAL and GGDEF domain